MEETIQWLTAKLDNKALAQGKFESKDKTERAVFAVDSFAVEKGVLKISTDWELTLDKFEPQKKTTSAPLRELSPNIEVTSLRDSGPWARWNWTPTSTVKLEVISRSGKNGFILIMDDAELAARVAKALTHLIELGGGKEEAF